MDSLTLEQVYDDATRRARRLVASRYPLETCEVSSPDYPAPGEEWRQVWYVTIENAESPLRLILALPFTFPDELPKVYVPIERAECIKRIPHIDKNRLLCTFDTTEVAPNLNCHPGQIALEVIQRAEQIWFEGTTGINHQDFDEEFEAYWAQSTNGKAIALIEPNGDSREIAAVSLIPKWKDASWLLVEKETEGKRWLSAVGHTNKGKCRPALYLPLKCFGIPPFPATNREIYKRLQENDPQALQRLLNFLGEKERPTAVLFSVPAGVAGRAMGLWWHPVFYHEVNRGLKNVKKQIGLIPGFRPGPKAAKLELSVYQGEQELTRNSVIQVHRERLFKRTAGTVPKTWDDPVSIIGCGSIGGFLAEHLARSGVVDRFRLIDPEFLNVENTARHPCGMSEVGLSKVAAIAQRISHHFPYIQCETHEKNILELLRASPTALEPSSLRVIAVGADAVERRLNRLFRASAQGWPGPTCFVWVEPYLYGGHAIYLHKDSPGCFECAFDDQFLFKYRVIQNPQRLSKREAGCQTTYVPYSGADAAHFVSALTRFLLSARDTSENLVFSWIGDLNGAKQEGLIIQPDWIIVDPFSIQVRTLQANPDCLVCNL